MKEQFEELVEKYSNDIRDYVNSLEETNLQLESTVKKLRIENEKLKKEQSPVSLDNGVLLSYKQLSNIINTLSTAETPEAKELAEYLIQFGNKTFNSQKNKDEFLPKDIIEKINQNTVKNEQAILNKKNNFDLFFNNPCHKQFGEFLKDFMEASPVKNKDFIKSFKKESSKDNLVKNNSVKDNSTKNDSIKDNLAKNNSTKNNSTKNDLHKEKFAYNPEQNLFYVKGIDPFQKQHKMTDAEQISELFNNFFVNHPQAESFVDIIDSLLKAKNHSDYNRWK